MTKLDLLALVDVETTGLNPATGQVIELGCILYSLSHNCILQQMSTLVPISCPGENPTLDINGITKASANSLATDTAFIKSLDFADSMVVRADAFVAHNAPFDKAFCLAAFGWGKSKPWIDTRAITWPRANRLGCNLVELALAYGLPVFGNHRALADCQLLAQIIQREPDVGRLLDKELQPKVWATWRSTPADIEGRNQVKAAGFRWKDDKCPANGVWSRLMHPDDIEALSFDVVTLAPNPCP